MKLYRISHKPDDGDEIVNWAGTEVLAKKDRAALMDSYGVRRQDVAIEPIEVPTKKEDLLAWLNERKV